MAVNGQLELFFMLAAMLVLAIQESHPSTLMDRRPTDVD